MIFVLFSEIIWCKKGQHKVSAGFTFIELLLIIGMVLVLSVPTSIFSTRLLHQSAVRNATEATKEMIREAQVQALSGKNNSDWGVKYQDSRAVLFAGQSFLSRDVKLDRVFEINEGIIVSGMDEILFESVSGRPYLQGYDIRFSWGNIQESIIVNPEGVIK